MKALEDAEVFLRQMPSQTTLSQRVRIKLVEELTHDPSATRIAKALFMSVRTLHRGLKSEGTSFRVLLSEIAANGFVAGIDHSATMLHTAAKRNASAIRKGRVALFQASATSLPSFSEPFDKIVSANVIQFFSDPVGVLKGIHGLLKPGGRVVVLYQSRKSVSTQKDAESAGKRIAAQLEEAGFSPVRLERRPMRPVMVVAAVGFRPDTL